MLSHVMMKKVQQVLVQLELDVLSKAAAVVVP